MTERLYRDDAYARSADAKVLAISDRGGIVLDRTVLRPLFQKRAGMLL